MTVNQLATDRSFKCTCCKRTILYETKCQCIVCPKIQICKLCFKGGYHDQHQFLARPGPDKDWEPAVREGIKPPAQTQEECQALYQKVTEELQSREITTENYELLMSLE